jgi:hypothetical protein
MRRPRVRPPLGEVFHPAQFFLVSCLEVKLIIPCSSLVKIYCFINGEAILSPPSSASALFHWQGHLRRRLQMSTWNAYFFGTECPMSTRLRRSIDSPSTCPASHKKRHLVSYAQEKLQILLDGTSSVICRSSLIRRIIGSLSFSIAKVSIKRFEALPELFCFP